jgi:hypothetical protein
VEKELAELQATNQHLIGENYHLLGENQALRMQLASPQGVYTPSSSSQGANPYNVGIGNPSFPQYEDGDVLMDPMPSATTSSPSSAPKRRSDDEPPASSPSSKHPHSAPPTVTLPDGAMTELRDSHMGLPLLLGSGDNPHLSGGAWSCMSIECPGRTLAKKVEWLCTNQHLSLYKDVTEELSALIAAGGSQNLGNMQRKFLSLRKAPLSLYKIAMINPQTAHPGVRWDNRIPNPGDLEVWSLIRSLTKTDTKNSNWWIAFRQALDEAVWKPQLWGSADAQLTGICVRDLDAKVPPTVEVVVSHFLACGVTWGFIHSSILPFLQRAYGSVPPSTAAPRAPEPAPFPGLTPEDLEILSTPESPVGSTPPLKSQGGSTPGSC